MSTAFQNGMVRRSTGSSILSPRAVIGLTVFAIVLASLFAYLEIQIEGQNGWAQSLPTWRFVVGHVTITGYHVTLALFLFVVMHWIFFVMPWSFAVECLVLSLFILFFLLEDSLWFLFQRWFFSRTLDDPWRQPKIGPFPVFYLVGLLLTLGFGVGTRSTPWMISLMSLLLLVSISFPFQTVRGTSSCPAPPT